MYFLAFMKRLEFNNKFEGVNQALLKSIVLFSNLFGSFFYLCSIINKATLYIFVIKT